MVHWRMSCGLLSLYVRDGLVGCGSARQVAPVDRKCDPRDVARLVRGQVEDRVGDLHWLGDPAKWVGGDEVLVHLGVLVHYAGDKRGVDQSRTDGIDAYTAVRVIEGGALSQADLGVLGGDIPRVAGDAGQSSARRDIDDGT